MVIVTLDGVRWQEIFHGVDASRSSTGAVPAPVLLPNLYELGLHRGAFLGAPDRGVLEASGPDYLSLPGYTELLTGRTSTCSSNECARTTLPSILDEASAHGAKVAAFASWEKLDLAVTAEPGRFRSSCGRGGDASVDAWPGEGDYRPDTLTADAALSYYAAEKPDVFFLGLGDPDEYAHHNDYEGYLAALRGADAILGRLISLIDSSGERSKRTTVIVTADHGRSRDFKSHGKMSEAARVWAAAWGPRFAVGGAVESPRTRRLSDIAPTVRFLLGMTPDMSNRAGSPIEELFL